MPVVDRVAEPCSRLCPGGVFVVSVWKITPSIVVRPPRTAAAIVIASQARLASGCCKVGLASGRRECKYGAGGKSLSSTNLQILQTAVPRTEGVPCHQNLLNRSVTMSSHRLVRCLTPMSKVPPRAW